MKYCPKCGSEFFDTIGLCNECDTELISEQQWKNLIVEQKIEAQEVFVKIKTVDDPFAADVIKDALEKEEIPVLVRSFQDTSFNGIFIPQKGWGILLVPDEFREKAKKIIEIVETENKKESESTEDKE